MNNSTPLQPIIPAQNQPLGTEFLNNANMGTSINQFTFSNGWNYQTLSPGEAYGGDNHWTNQVGATVIVNFISSKFYIVAIKSPNYGIMTISIDGSAEIDIDLYANTRIFKQIVYESAILSNTPHKVVLRCSGRKNSKATGISSFIDGIFIQVSTGLTFINDSSLGNNVNQFNFSNGWITEILNVDEAYGGDDHWTPQVGATASVSVITSKFYIVAVKDPYHGIMTISIDGGAEIDIDLYASIRTFKQIVYESSVLSNGQHKILLKCSGRKNPKAIGSAAFIDGIFIQASTTLTFINNSMIGTGINKFNFSNGWNIETLNTNEVYGGDDHWTSQTGATAKITFNGTKLYIISVKDPNHGIMEVSIDNGNPIDVDLYNSNRVFKQMVFESVDLSNNNHTLTIKCSGRKNPKALGNTAFIDGIFILDNYSIGLFEFEKAQYSFNENIRVATLKVLRKGGTRGTVSVNYITSSGTALEGINYQSWIGTLYFNSGENEKIITIPIINTNNIITSKNFKLKLSKPLGGAIFGIINETTINLFPKTSTINIIPQPTIPPSNNTISNLALNKKAVSSSNESNTLAAIYVTDGKTTRWASGNFSNGSQWIYIDLAKVMQFNVIRIAWHSANATVYRIEYSNDTITWTSIYKTTIAVGKTETISLNSKQNARYVRVFCEKSNPLMPSNNVSIYEIEIYNL